MTNMHELVNCCRPAKSRKRLGRGVGSKHGRTCGRGEKGAGSRSGYKRRWGYEGGQMRLHMKTPKRGFNQARFAKPYESVNLGMIDAYFQDGDEVTPLSLYLRGLIKGKGWGVKVLGDGEITKKVTIIADHYSESAREKLEKAQIAFSVAE